MRLMSLSLLTFTRDDTVVLGKGQPGDHCCLVSFNTDNQALEFADLAGSNVLKPDVELFSGARSRAGFANC